MFCVSVTVKKKIETFFAIDRVRDLFTCSLDVKEKNRNKYIYEKIDDKNEEKNLGDSV